MKERIFANDNIILIQISNNKFLVYRGLQTLELKSTDGYKEITNKSVKAILIKNHNDFIIESLLHVSGKDRELESLLYKALLDEEEYNE